MPTLTAKPNTAAASVNLSINDISGVTAIHRADVNGTRPVRLRPGALGGTGARTFTDYEPALTRVLYRVLHAKAPAEAWADLSAVSSPRFILPAIPQFSVAVESITGYSAERKSTARFHEVINRSSPLVAEGRMGTRAGSLSAMFRTYAEAADLENMLKRGQTAMLRQADQPGLDMYFNSSRVSVKADPDAKLWEVAVSFTELAFPAGNVLSRADWSFDALARTVPSFDAVATRYESFNDLTIGQEK